MILFFAFDNIFVYLLYERGILYSGNSKTRAEMTPQEQKISLTIMGFMLLGIIAYGVYYFFKNRKNK